MQRKYDPNLIWAYTARWAQDKHPDRRPGGLQVYVYVNGKTGAYYLGGGPKLYWDETVGDGYFSNTDQNGLETDADGLKEVVVYGVGQGRSYREPVTFISYKDFLMEIGLREED